jgi:aminoglycoside phosphotransferase (APT) family kinase protein
MRGTLGEKIGEGNFADVHAWAKGQVVKLFKPGFSQHLSAHEARMTRAAFAAGAPAPEVLGEVTVDGRFGIVLSRLDGPTLLQLTRDGTMTFARAGAILADLVVSVHRTPPPRDVSSLRDWIDHVSRHDGRGRLSSHTAAGVLALIDRLRPAGELCHGDLHPSNTIMTVEGPRLVDWTWSMRGPAALDLAFSHFILTEFAPERVDDPRRPRAVNAAMQSEYARLTGTSPAVLTAAIEGYLPIVYAFNLLLGPEDALREQLTQRLEAALPPDQSGFPANRDT